MNKKNLTSNSLFYKPYLYYDIYIKNKYLKKRNSYSQHGEDSIIIEYFKDNGKGIYLDLGCYHPIKYSNTNLLFRNLWQGINIDMNPMTIDLFKIARPKDFNLCEAISNEEKKEIAYFDDYVSPINTLNKNFSDYASKKISLRTHKKKEINTLTLESIIKKNNINLKKIDFLNIDIEGMDYDVLTSIDLKKYNPKVICVEMYDKNFKLDKAKFENYLNNYQYSLKNFVGSNTGIFVLD